MDDVWTEHLRAEFSAYSPDETIVTMSTNPLINQVPVMIGGNGREEVYEGGRTYLGRLLENVHEQCSRSQRRTRTVGGFSKVARLRA